MMLNTRTGFKWPKINQRSCLTVLTNEKSIGTESVSVAVKQIWLGDTPSDGPTGQAVAEMKLLARVLCVLVGRFSIAGRLASCYQRVPHSPCTGRRVIAAQRPK